MKIAWFVISGTTVALAALIVSPALGQTQTQRVTVVNSGSSQHSQISTVNSSSISTGGTSHRQETQLRIRAVNLNQPYRLNVQSSAATLGGEIKLNGRAIHRLEGHSSSLDLSPHLSVGDHVVEITGSYTPTRGTVHISLVGPGTTLTQEISGQGQLSNRIRLSVQ